MPFYPDFLKFAPRSITHGILSYDFSTDEATSAHESVSGTALRELQTTDFSLASLESGLYHELIDQHMAAAETEDLVLDAGCGDGRFTLRLVEKKLRNVVALDSNFDSLVRLRQILVERGLQDSVTLVHASVMDLPFNPGMFRWILAVGVLYYLNDSFEKGHKQLTDCLATGGVLIESEPDREGNALKALVFDGVEQFVRVINHNRFVEVFGEDKFEFRCFDGREIEKILEDGNMKLLATAPIPLYPSLFAISRRKAHWVFEASGGKGKILREALRKISQESALAKHRMWISQKQSITRNRAGD